MLGCRLVLVCAHKVTQLEVLLSVRPFALQQHFFVLSDRSKE
jgi:hypothetical protein